MSIFPSTPEIVLAIFTTLLSLAVSLFLLKIQITNTKSVKSLEQEQKILVAQQSETADLIRGKLINSKEIQDAIDFLIRDASIYVDEIEKNFTMLENQQGKISKMTWLGIVLMLCSLGVNTYFTFHMSESDVNVSNVNVLLQESIVAVVINILFWAFMLYLGKLVRKHDKDVGLLSQRYYYMSNEILKAIKLLEMNVEKVSLD